LPSRKPEPGAGPTTAPAAAPPAARAGGRLRITLVRSLIGLKPKHVATLRALGLRKIRATVLRDDTPAVRGMLAKVPYAVRVEEEESA